MSDDSTEKLTAALESGSEPAVEAFYRQYFDWLYAQARLATRRDESFCLDVVQNAVLRIIRTVRPVRSEAQFRAWMRLVVQTAALDLIRSDARRARREFQAVMSGAAQPGEPEQFDESQQRWLRQQIERLDPQLATMIALRYEQDWTLERIGRLLGLSIGTIDGRLRRALKMLRDRANEAFDD